MFGRRRRREGSTAEEAATTASGTTVVGTADAEGVTGDDATAGTAARTDDAAGAAASTGDAAAGSAPVEPGPAPKSERPEGPWDLPEVEDAREGRIDLGSLLLPAVQGAQLRLDVEQATQRVTAASLVLGDSAVRLQAFAAPRNEGIWPEVAQEVAASVVSQGGQATLEDGAFGPEVVAVLPAQMPDGTPARQVLRFVGVDGPRWLLRAVFSGRAGHQPEAFAALGPLLRGVVVVRGVEARPPREPLELTMPSGASPVVPDAAAGAAGHDHEHHDHEHHDHDQHADEDRSVVGAAPDGDGHPEDPAADGARQV